MPHTRESLLFRIGRSRDPDAWNEFVRTYHPYLLQVILRSRVPVDAAADVAQNVFVSLLKELPRFGYRPDRGRFRAWLSQVTRNASVDWLRRRDADRRHIRRAIRKSALIDSIPTDADEGDPNGSARRQVRLDAALAQVCACSETTTWNCFEQHVLQRRPAAAVARDLGLPTNNVYVNASRILARLRKICRQDEFAVESLSTDPLPQ